MAQNLGQQKQNLEGKFMPRSAAATGLQFENKVRGSLKRIGFKDVDGGAKFVVGGFQVDAVGGWDDTLLIVEATQTSRTSASIRERIVQIRGKVGDLRRGFRESDSYIAYRRFEFALVTEGYDFSEADRQLAVSPDSGPKIHLIDDQVLQYYQRLAEVVGKPSAVFNFLGELGVEPRDLRVHRTPAFRVELHKGIVGYLFFCEPQKLLEIAYVARRETGREHYYQRMLTTARLRSIRGFIDDGGVFANNVIIAFDTKPQFKSMSMSEVDSPPWLEWGELAFPKSYRAAWIIDGQHRLYAFGVDQQASGSQKLPVFAFEQLTESKQADFFIQINREQKPVSPDLIWDLEADLRPDTPRGRVALAVKRLNRSGPLKGKIYYPLSGEKSQAKIKISSVCTDINELRLLDDRTRNMTQSQLNPLTRAIPLDKRVNRVADGIAAFLDKVLSVQEAEPYRDNVILKPGGITLILTVYEQVLIKLGTRPQGQQLEEYATALVLALDQVVGGRGAGATFVKNRLTSYAQRREVVVQIVNSMRSLLNDENFGPSIDLVTPLERRVTETERGLAAMVCNTLEVHAIKGLKQKAPEHVWRNVEKRSQDRPDEPLHHWITFGEIKEIMGRQDNKSDLIGKFINDASDFSSEDEVFVALDRLINLRNALQHGRTVRNQRLGETYLSAFERLLDRE